MRQIKFGAWDKKNKRMVQVAAIEFTDPVEGRPGITVFVEDRKECYWLNNGEFEILRFTGLLDKNGKEIYEGDILRIGDENDGEINPLDSNTGFGDVCFLIECGLWYVDKINNGLADLKHEYSDIKIIGNIYENPELLK